MEEADTLAQRIAIIAGGKLRCVGSQLRLKKRFGDGYKLSVNLTEATDAAVARATQFIHDNITTDATMASHVSNSVSYMIPQESVDMARMFQVFEESKADGGITEWGCAQSSLEEVFVKVVKQAEAEMSAVGEYHDAE